MVRVASEAVVTLFGKEEGYICVNCAWKIDLSFIFLGSYNYPKMANLSLSEEMCLPLLRTDV